MVIDPLVQKVDQVDGVFVHTVQEDIRGVQNDTDFYLWVQLVVLFQERREDGCADGLDGADGEGAGQFGGFCDGGFGAFQVFHDGDGVVVEDGTLVGEDGLFADAVEKMDAEFFFQVFDLDGDGGLGVAQVFGGFGEAF